MVEEKKIDERKINRKGFEGKYKEEIEKGLIESYKRLYPDKTIRISYYDNQSEYSFYVYVDGFKAFDPINKDIIIKELMVQSYSNLAAIKFSSISVEEYHKKYNDYSYENYDYIKEQIEAIQVALRISNSNILITNVQIGDRRVACTVSCSEGKKTTSQYSKWFNVIPISMATAKVCVNDIKNKVKNVQQRSMSVK